MTHAELCAALGIEPMEPTPLWLPYAYRARRIEIVSEDRRWVFGGSFRCGQCEFGLDIQPGPGTQHPEPEARLRCPKCGFDGKSAPQHVCGVRGFDGMQGDTCPACAPPRARTPESHE